MNDIELPEPVAWLDPIDLETLSTDGWCVVHASASDPAADHAAEIPLYTADQLRTAIAAERAKDIHSCHPNCARAGCVNERLRAEVEAMRDCLHKVPIPPRAITYEHGVELLDELQRLAVAARSGETT